MPHGRPTSSALRSAANPERPVGGHSVRPQGTAQGGSSLTLAGGAALIVAAAGWALRRWQGDAGEGEPLRSLVLLAMAGQGQVKVDPTSFVQTDLRTAAMKLHTRDQSREGEQEAQKPISQWTFTKGQLVGFLVNSRVVHHALDEAVLAHPGLAGLCRTGLERVASIDEDIATLQAEDPTLMLPAPYAEVEAYAARLREMARDDVPAFICHFYNTHFAHTAGGQMIGRLLSTKVLDGRPLKFYQWDGDVQDMLAGVRRTIDGLAAGWTPAQRAQCVAETAAAFEGSGEVLRALKEPQ
eukprot:EG_transcript_16567